MKTFSCRTCAREMTPLEWEWLVGSQNYAFQGTEVGTWVFECNMCAPNNRPYVGLVLNKDVIDGH